MSHTSLFALLPVSLLSGCATITVGRSQEIVIGTQEDNGNAIAGVNCRFSNDKGNWDVQTPGAVHVFRSVKDMRIECDKAGVPRGTAVIVSCINAGMLGNALLTCGIGMPIDYLTGAGFDYVSPIAVTMGKEARFENGSGNAAGK